MNFYQQTGALVLGTRLRRISEYFLSEVNKTYLENNIDFEASWFGVFYLLKNEQEVSMRDLSDKLEISHSAVSQMVKVLVQKNLIQFITSPDDGRKKILSFTEQGQLTLSQIEPIWQGLAKAINEILAQENCTSLLENLLNFENALTKTSLNKRICLNTEKIS